jgi:DNA-binding CsgD family transcriptional regulator
MYADRSQHPSMYARTPEALRREPASADAGQATDPTVVIDATSPSPSVQDPTEGRELPSWALELLTGDRSEETSDAVIAALEADWLRDAHECHAGDPEAIAAAAQAHHGLPIDRADVLEALTRHGLRRDRRRTSELTRELLVEHYVEGGQTLAEIGDALGISRETVRQARDRFGIAPRVRGIEARVSTEQVRELYWTQGLSLADTAAQLGVSQAALVRLMDDHDIVRRAQATAEDLVDLELARTLLDEGLSVRQLAARFGVSDGTLARFLRASGIQLAGKRRLHEEVTREELEQWLADGCTLVRIASQLGCTTRSVIRLKDRYGL